MKRAAKVGVVVAGYVGAFAIAAVVVAVSAFTSGPDRSASSGMAAFGDMILFIGVFGFLALVPTCAGLIFLRPYAWFWRALALAAVTCMTTEVLAITVYVAERTAAPASWLHAWSALAVLRLLGAPLVAGTCLIAGVVAPDPMSRRVLLISAVVEAGVFVGVVALWIQSRAG